MEFHPDRIVQGNDERAHVQVVRGNRSEHKHPRPRKYYRTACTERIGRRAQGCCNYQSVSPIGRKSILPHFHFNSQHCSSLTVHGDFIQGDKSLFLAVLPHRSREHRTFLHFQIPLLKSLHHVLRPVLRQKAHPAHIHAEHRDSPHGSISCCRKEGSVPACAENEFHPFELNPAFSCEFVQRQNFQFHSPVPQAVFKTHKGF